MMLCIANHTQHRRHQAFNLMVSNMELDYHTSGFATIQSNH